MSRRRRLHLGKRLMASAVASNLFSSSAGCINRDPERSQQQHAAFLLKTQNSHNNLFPCSLSSKQYQAHTCGFSPDIESPAAFKRQGSISSSRVTWRQTDNLRPSKNPMGRVSRPVSVPFLPPPEGSLSEATEPGPGRRGRERDQLGGVSPICNKPHPTSHLLRRRHSLACLPAPCLTIQVGNKRPCMHDGNLREQAGPHPPAAAAHAPPCHVYCFAPYLEVSIPGN